MVGIHSHTWNEGDSLPSERELAAQLGLSRLTVRQAMTELAQEGIVTRSRGRGTYVRKPPIHQPLQRLSSFSEDMRAIGKEPGSHVLKFELRPASVEEMGKLCISARDTVVELRRLRTADGQPMGVETAVLPLSRVEAMTRVSFDELASLYHVLRVQCGIQLERADQWIEASLCTEMHSTLLTIRVGEPVLRAQRVTYSADGDVVEWVRSVYRGDMYRLHVVLATGN